MKLGRVRQREPRHGRDTLCTSRQKGTQHAHEHRNRRQAHEEALKATGAKTKREAVELGLKTLVQLRAQEKARELKGKITWEGDLNAMRTDR